MPTSRPKGDYLIMPVCVVMAAICYFLAYSGHARNADFPAVVPFMIGTFYAICGIVIYWKGRPHADE